MRVLDHTRERMDQYVNSFDKLPSFLPPDARRQYLARSEPFLSAGSVGDAKHRKETFLVVAVAGQCIQDRPVQHKNADRG